MERGEEKLHVRWRGKRAERLSYADPRHPFQHQGSADINTYKMFLEQAHGLLKPGGKLGMIVPSGVYTDKGSSGLRQLFLEHCRWEWLFGFENRDKIFDIHRSFKFCPIVVAKGGKTEAVRAAFMRHDLRDWEEADRHIIFYPHGYVDRFSPRAHAILEVGEARDLAVLEKIYGNATLLGDVRGRSGAVDFRRDFHMTDDAKLFPARIKWEALAFRPDSTGRWVQPETGKVAVPLIQGSMLWHFDCAYQQWCNNNWVKGDLTTLAPKFLLDQSDIPGIDQDLLFAFRDITGATNERTAVGALLPALPSGNTVGLLANISAPLLFRVLAAFNSYCFDWTARLRLGGTHLNWYIGAELPIALPPDEIAHLIDSYVMRIAMNPSMFTPFWVRFGNPSDYSRRAFTAAERTRIRCVLDAVAAELYGLEVTDLYWLLRDCDQPAELPAAAVISTRRNPKGFWRVDRDRDPELRQTVLTLIAFGDLKKAIRSRGDRLLGLQDFLGGGAGDGWMLPETVCLANHGLGRDQRAKIPQPVSKRLGDRFHPWQLEQSVDDSWAECQRHAQNLLGADGYRRLNEEIASGATLATPPRSHDPTATSPSAQVRLFPRDRDGTLFDDGTEDPV